MRWTRFLIPTSKEVPKDAVVASHQLMLRAGLIRQLAAGVYSYLPLGYRALRKVEAIVREEMNRAGAIELHLPVLHPIDLWKQTGRTAAMGDVLLRLRPVKDGDEGDWRAQTVLGPTHEEPITEIARAYLNSYKLLPVNLYQIQVKFRGEARPKSGVLRTREFLMKDAYSFHRDKASLDEGYQKMYDAYCRIFARCGLPYIAVEAESGPIGGDASHEFMVLTDAGEDVVALSENGDYAANTERAVAALPPPAGAGSAAGPGSATEADAEMKPLEEVHTPGQSSIVDVCALLKRQPREMIKTLIFSQVPAGGGRATSAAQPPSALSHVAQPPSAVSGVAQPPSAVSAGAGPAGGGRATPALKPVVALVCGDHELNEHKLAKVTGLKLEMADARTIEQLTGAAVGFAGPQGLADKLAMLVIDPTVAGLRNAVTGANKTDYHVLNVNPGRDFPLGDSGSPNGVGRPGVPAGSRAEGQGHAGGAENPGHAGGRAGAESPAASRGHVIVADIRNVVDGDLSPTGSGSPMRLRKAIEIGHVFKLGTKYSDALEAKFLDQDGKPKPLIMGCYGIGLNRIMAAAIEAHHDEAGIIWPASIAPFDVLIVALDPRDADVMNTAAQLHDELEAAGLDVLLDDRDERAGFKFKDADLIGIPLRITVGRKALAEGVVELKRRDAAEVEKCRPQEAAGWVKERVSR